jgi:hypothetical protein
MGAVMRIAGDSRAIIWLDVLRLTRDLKSVVALLAIISVPVAGAMYGANAFHLHAAMSLFLPVLVGWSWGRDLSAGTLAPLAYGAIRPVSLLGSRFAAFALAALMGHLIAALASRGEPIEACAAIVFAMHMLLLGFFLATICRSAEVGWLPLFAAFAGVWLPVVSTMKRTGGDVPQPWLHGLAVLFTPGLATSLAFTTTVSAMIVHITASVLWAVLAMFAVVRLGAIR